MAGWYLGANMKPMLVCLMHSATPSGPRSTATPSASRTSADPHMDETDRLPCLATLAPAAAARMHEPVEMLTVPASSPPVPTMSRTSFPASTVTARAHGAGHAGHLLGGLALGAHENEKGGDLRGVRVDEGVERLLGLVRGEVLGGAQALDDVAEVHRAASHRAAPRRRRESPERQSLPRRSGAVFNR